MPVCLCGSSNHVRGGTIPFDFEGWEVVGTDSWEEQTGGCVSTQQDWVLCRFFFIVTTSQLEEAWKITMVLLSSRVVHVGRRCPVPCCGGRGLQQSPVGGGSGSRNVSTLVRCRESHDLSWMSRPRVRRRVVGWHVDRHDQSCVKRSSRKLIKLRDICQPLELRRSSCLLFVEARGGGN